MATKQKAIRVAMYLRKKKGITEEEFNHYWSHVHGPLVKPVVEKYGFSKYTQYHTSKAVQNVSIAGWPELKDMTQIPYDGVAEFIVPDIETFNKTRDDPFFAEKIRPDEEKFFEVTDAGWFIGWEEVFVKDGKIVPDAEVYANQP